jgi:sigma-B regulation protein RsbU (phosphoserine phosphatase)
MDLQNRLNYMVATLRDLSRDQDPVGSINGYAAAMRHLFMDRGLLSISRRGVGPGEYRVMRMLHQEGVTGPGLADTLHAGADAPRHTGGFLAEVMQRTEPFLTRTLDLPNDPVLGTQLAPYRMMAGCPVFDLGEPTNWVFFLHTDPEGFSDRDVEMLILQANLMSGVTNAKRMAKEVLDANKYIQQQMDEIASIQRRLLPSKIPAIPGLDAAAMYATYDRAGGDYYDFIPLRQLDSTNGDDPRWLITIADASGHGPSAAVLVSMLSALLHSYPAAPERPCQVLGYLNQHLLRRSPHNAFVTAVLMIYDPRERSVAYASAGHPMPLLRRACGEVEELPRTGGVPLGIMPNVNYKTARLSLDPGQSLLLYSDGITEARNAQREMFETARLHEALSICGEKAQVTLDRIVDQLRVHESGVRQQDDQTLMVLHAT